MKKYSLKKGLFKGLVSATTILIALVAFAGFSDMTIWSLLETYLKPVLGSLTVGAVFTMIRNYFKVQAGNKNK